MYKLKLIPLSPGRIFLTSFVFIISMGTILLSLPISRTKEILLIDILFTAASTTCVTGLSVEPISSFTTFGKIIILIMIQIGGLGLVTLSLFVASLFLNLGMTSRLIAGEILEFELWGKVKQFLAIIIGVTLLSEILGTLVLYYQFKSIPTLPDPFFCAVFHSVSAFCNAGISTFDSSLQGLGNGILITISFLMFAGGIGFIVWYDILKNLKAFVKSTKETPIFLHFSLHTKITVFATLLLTACGGLLIWLIERTNLLKNFDLFSQIVNATFNGMSARGVGFSSISIANAHLATLFLLLILMFIGVGPGSTGGGIKTTTFVVFIASVLSTLRNRDSVEICERKIPGDQINKVMTIVTLGAFWIFLSTFILLLSTTSFSFMEIIFEAVSAFSNCGLSTGITPYLSIFGKSVLIITMLIGRVGGLTLVLALRKRAPKHLYRYPEERVMIG